MIEKILRVSALVLAAVLTACSGSGGTSDNGSTQAAGVTTGGSGTTGSSSSSSSSSSSTGSTGGSSGTTTGPGAIAFSNATYTVAQNAGVLTVTVLRTNGSTGNVDVNYATSNGTASSGTDYTAASGKLSWSGGDSTAKTFTVAVSSLPAFAGNKTFTITLSAPTNGASLGTQSSATATISGSASAVTSGAMGQTAAARLLMQGTFGATLNDITTVAGMSYDAWFSSQATQTPNLSLPYVKSFQPTNQDWTNAWFSNVVQGQDQLRQRMAFALSQILVASDRQSTLAANNVAMAAYYDILVKDALGNYRTLLDDVTLSPTMGVYLSLMHSDKPDPTTNVHADQNYAREVMQLFTVGLVKLNIDGTVQMGSNGIPLPTYAQIDVENLANALSGWHTAPPAGSSPDENNWRNAATDFEHPMVAYPNHHDLGVKTIIGGVTIPAGGTGPSDLKIALDTVFNHPNVGPFIAQQLIQRMVTSNPSPAYVQRVAQVFNNNGQGVRGDLLAVAKAILTDSEAVTSGSGVNPDLYGKLREPLLRLTNLWRAFNASDSNGKITNQEGNVQYYGASSFAQMPLDSPSVFNFFRPDFQMPGPLTDNKLVAPEFQITNENTLVLTANLLQKLAYYYADSTGTSHAGANGETLSIGSTSILLHTSQWEAFAADPATLVDKLNLVLMPGYSMPQTMKSTLINYIAGIPAGSAGTRVVEAAELVINSPQYAVQR